MFLYKVNIEIELKEESVLGMFFIVRIKLLIRNGKSILIWINCIYILF